MTEKEFTPPFTGRSAHIREQIEAAVEYSRILSIGSHGIISDEDQRFVEWLLSKATSDDQEYGPED